MTKAQKEIQEDKQKEKRAHWSRLCWGNFGQLERKHFKTRVWSKVDGPKG